MHSISSRWRKPVSRLSKKKLLAIEKSRKRWEKLASKEVQASDQQIEENENFSDVNTCAPDENTASSSVKEIVPSHGANLEMKKDVCGRSKEKIDTFLETHEHKTPGNYSYTLVNELAWPDLLKQLPCTNCGCHNLTVKVESQFGYSSKLEVICMLCEAVQGSTFSSPRVQKGGQFHINKSIVEAFLNIGKGHSALEMFSMTLGVHALDRKTFSKCIFMLVEEGKDVKNKLLALSRQAVHTRYSELDSSLNNDSIIDVSVSYDGTWHKRGYNSMYGIGIVIDILTGLVLDYEVLSKYCHQCATAEHDLGANSPEFYFWQEGHKSCGRCERNFMGSSSSMEVHAAKILWKRSIEVNAMRYTTVLSDGDAKTYTMLCAENIYGDEAPITKQECLNHVAKRLGTSLRNKVKEWRVKGICLGGRKKGSLSESAILKLTNFYRKAIRENVPNLDDTKTAIYATLYHAMSTDQNPQHSKCPKGETSWCFFNRAVAKNEKPESHKNMKMPLTQKVVSKILPIYQRLASDELLSQCTLGKTQNNNESLHSVIWSFCPKETFVSKKRIDLATLTAVSQFNMGNESSLHLKESAPVNNTSINIAKQRDHRRSVQCSRRSSASYKNSQCVKKFKTTKSEQKLVNSEGPTYGAGQF